MPCIMINNWTETLYMYFIIVWLRSISSTGVHDIVATTTGYALSSLIMLNKTKTINSQRNKSNIKRLKCTNTYRRAKVVTNLMSYSDNGNSNSQLQNCINFCCYYKSTTQTRCPKFRRDVSPVFRLSNEKCIFAIIMTTAPLQSTRIVRPQFTYSPSICTSYIVYNIW